MGNYDKIIKYCNRLKYEDGSFVEVKLDKDNSIKGFKFYLTDVGLKFEKKIDKICKQCGFNNWIPCGKDSISFY